MGQMSRSILVVFLLAFACVTQAHLISSRESHSTSSPDFQEKEVASHIASKIQECIGQCPKDHGILVQIQDLSSDASTRASTEDGKEKDWKSRGFCESVGKGWDSMPFDQRLGVASSIVATLTGPLYMMNSGVSFNEYEIGNVKDQLVAQASNNKTHHHTPNVLPPPPPAVAPAPAAPAAPASSSTKHSKRSFLKGMSGLMQLVRRDLGKPEGHNAEEYESPASANTETASDAKEEKATKQSNSTVSRFVSMLGLANSMLYIPAALVTAVRTVLVRDSDTATYKRSISEDAMKGFTVTCKPIQKVNEQQYQMPARAPVYKTHYKRAVLPMHPKEEEEKAAVVVKSPSTVKSEEMHETLENIHRNETLSEMEREQEEKSTLIQEQDVPLQRRTPQLEHPNNNGGGPHGSEGGPPGGPGRAGPLPPGPIHEESIKHVYYVDDKHLPSDRKPNAGGLSKMQMGMIALGGAAAGYGALSMYQASQAPPTNARGQQMSPQYAQAMAQQLAQQRLAAQYAQQYPQMASRSGAGGAASSKSSPYYDDYDPYYDDGDEYGDLDDDIYAAALAAALEKKAAAKGAPAKTTTTAATTPAAAAVVSASPAVAVTEAPTVLTPVPAVTPVVAPVVAAQAAVSDTAVIQAAPIVAVNNNGTSTAPTRRSIYSDLSGEILFKRNPPPEKRPGGPELDPFLVKTQFEIQHHNTPYDQIPGYDLGYGKKREPAGPPGSPEQLAQEELERKEEEALAKSQKTPWGKVAAIGVGGAIVGALYKTFYGTPAPQPVAQQGYYGGQDDYYRKRELVVEKSDPIVKRSPETYDEIIRSLKDEAAREREEQRKRAERERRRRMDRIEYDSDANGQHFAVNKSKSNLVPAYYDDEGEEDEVADDNDGYLYRRDNSDLQYDVDADGQHFSVIQREGKKVQDTEEDLDEETSDGEDDEGDDLRRRSNPSIEYDGDGDSQHFAVYQKQGDEETWQRRGDSSIVYDDTGDSQHFAAIIPDVSSLPEDKMVADEVMDSAGETGSECGEIDLERREDSKIEYDANAQKQHFRVTKGEEVGETSLQRRRDATISLDSDPSGSHFKAVLPSASSKKDDDESVHRRSQEDTIDYHAGQDNDVTFTAHAHLEPKVQVEDSDEEEMEDDEEDQDVEDVEEGEEDDDDDDEMKRRGEASISLDTSKDGSSHFVATIPADAEKSHEAEEEDEIKVSRREEADISYHNDKEHGTDFHASTKHPQEDKQSEKSIDINTCYGKNGVVTIEIAPQDDSESHQSTCKKPSYAPDR